MNFEFCWEHRDCDKLCPVRESQSIFCWRIARTERLCHPDVCAQCSYRRNWFGHEYSLQEFIRNNDRRHGRRQAKRVLVVDDEPFFLYALEETVREIGYNCMTAIDGEEGLFFAQEALPDLVITDIMMPKVDGYELCRTLKRDARTRDIPVIIVTVRHTQKDIDEGTKAGAAAYLVKPLKPASLVKYISALAPHAEQE